MGSAVAFFTPDYHFRLIGRTAHFNHEPHELHEQGKGLGAKRGRSLPVAEFVGFVPFVAHFLAYGQGMFTRSP